MRISPSDMELARALGRRMTPPAVVLGVGSALRGDAAFGIETSRLLASEGLSGIEVLEGGSAPENLAERAARNSPRTVVFLDAAEFDGEPGELRLVDPAELGWNSSASTHAPSLELLATYLHERCGAKSVMLAACARETSLGESM